MSGEGQKYLGMPITEVVEEVYGTGVTDGDYYKGIQGLLVTQEMIDLVVGQGLGFPNGILDVVVNELLLTEEERLFLEDTP